MASSVTKGQPIEKQKSEFFAQFFKESLLNSENLYGTKALQILIIFIMIIVLRKLSTPKLLLQCHASREETNEM